MEYKADRRNTSRRASKLSVQFVLENGASGIGRVIDRSTTGIALLIDVDLDVNDKISVLSAETGRLTGRVARVFSGGVAIELDVLARPETTHHSSGYVFMADLLEPNGGEKRAYERIPCAVEINVRIDGTDVTFNCIVLDMSRSGCFIKSDEKPEIGAPVIVNKRRGTVRRHSEDGFGVQFAQIAAQPAQKESAPINHAA